MWRRSWLHKCRSSVQHYISDTSSSSYPTPSYPTLRPSVSRNLRYLSIRYWLVAWGDSSYVHIIQCPPAFHASTCCFVCMYSSYMKPNPRHGNAGRTLSWRQGKRKRDGYCTGRAGTGRADRSTVRRGHVRVRREVCAISCLVGPGFRRRL